MKKKLIPTTVFMVIAVITAAVFAEEAAKPRPARQPERPGVRTPRTRSERPQQRTRNMDAIIQQQAKRIESEISRLNKIHQVEVDQLKAVLKQAQEEKAVKTAAMLKDMIEKKNAENAEKIKHIQKRAEDFKKRIQRGPRNATTRTAPKDKSARENMPPRKSRTRTKETK